MMPWYNHYPDYDMETHYTINNQRRMLLKNFTRYHGSYVSYSDPWYLCVVRDLRIPVFMSKALWHWQAWCSSVHTHTQIHKHTHTFPLAECAKQSSNHCCSCSALSLAKPGWVVRNTVRPKWHPTFDYVHYFWPGPQGKGCHLGCTHCLQTAD